MVGEPQFRPVQGDSGRYSICPIGLGNLRKEQGMKIQTAVKAGAQGGLMPIG